MGNRLSSSAAPAGADAPAPLDISREVAHSTVEAIFSRIAELEATVAKLEAEKAALTKLVQTDSTLKSTGSDRHRQKKVHASIRETEDGKFTVLEGSIVVRELTESGKAQGVPARLHEACARDGRFEEISVGDDQRAYQLTADVVIESKSAVFVFCLGSQGGKDTLHDFEIPLFLDNVARRI